jgi:hypothetical protein
MNIDEAQQRLTASARIVCEQSVRNSPAICPPLAKLTGHRHNCLL